MFILAIFLSVNLGFSFWKEVFKKFVSLFYCSYSFQVQTDPIDTQGQSTSNVAEILPLDRFGVVGVKYAESDTTESQIFLLNSSAPY